LLALITFGSQERGKKSSTLPTLRPAFSACFKILLSSFFISFPAFKIFLSILTFTPSTVLNVLPDLIK